MANLKFILYALVFILFLIFIVQNYPTLTASHSLRLNIFLADLETVPLPFYLIALILFFLGFILATLLRIPRSRRTKKELKESQMNNRRLEQQVTQLRDQAKTAGPEKKAAGLAANAP